MSVIPALILLSEGLSREKKYQVESLAVALATTLDFLVFPLFNACQDTHCKQVLVLPFVI